MRRRIACVDGLFQPRRLSLGKAVAAPRRPDRWAYRALGRLQQPRRPPSPRAPLIDTDPPASNRRRGPRTCGCRARAASPSETPLPSPTGGPAKDPAVHGPAVRLPLVAHPPHRACASRRRARGQTRKIQRRLRSSVPPFSPSKELVRTRKHWRAEKLGRSHAFGCGVFPSPTAQCRLHRQHCSTGCIACSAVPNT